LRIDKPAAGAGGFPIAAPVSWRQVENGIGPDAFAMEKPPLRYLTPSTACERHRRPSSIQIDEFRISKIQPSHAWTETTWTA
jgi:DNA primase